MCMFSFLVCIFFFKQKTAYEMRISDWSSDVCSSDLQARGGRADLALVEEHAPGGRLDRRVEMRTIGEHDLRCLTAEFETDALQVAFAGIDHQIGRASCRERVCQYV